MSALTQGRHVDFAYPLEVRNRRPSALARTINASVIAGALSVAVAHYVASERWYVDPPSAVARPMPASAFVTEFPELRRLERWGGGIVALADRLYLIEPDGRTAVPLELPGGGAVVDFAMMGETPVVLLARPEPVLLVGKADGRGGEWKEMPLPAALSLNHAADLRLAPDGEALVVWGAAGVFLWQRGAWTGPVDVGEIGRGGMPVHGVYAAGKLYLGYDHGEWGGALVSCDLQTGAAHPGRVAEGPGDGIGEPIRQVHRDCTGTLWATGGLAHLGYRSGSLHRLDVGQQKWVLVARTEPAMRHGHDRPGDEPFRATTFSGVAFDPSGRLHVLASSRGLVRLEADRSWTALTPGWPNDERPVGAVVDEARAVIATDRAIVIVNLLDHSVRPVVHRLR